MRGAAHRLRREELRGYCDDLYHGYTEAFGAASCAVSRMKAHWFYLIHRFEGADPLEKPLRKAREGWEYETVVNQIFTRQLFETENSARPRVFCETAGRKQDKRRSLRRSGSCAA